jgi:hypothetical protein
MNQYWLNRESLSFSLNTVYAALGISKQALHQRLNRQLKIQSYEHQLLYLVHELREEHPAMGCRDMYHLLQPECMGRDAFEWFCKANGFSVERKINYCRTTDSSGVVRFKNLTVNLVLNRLNQVWVSDITYFYAMGRFYYLTFITDAFSRKIIGYNVSKRLFTESTSLAALEMAFKDRKGVDLRGTIFHSDGGGQYYADGFLKKTAEKGMVNSMCEYPWENGKAERVNGIIKNNYLRHRSIHSDDDLYRELDRSVLLYNEKKPHKALNKVTPVNFELAYIRNGKTSESDESTTDNAIRPGMASKPFDADGKTSFGSDITQDYATKSNVK